MQSGAVAYRMATSQVTWRRQAAAAPKREAHQPVVRPLCRTVAAVFMGGGALVRAPVRDWSEAAGRAGSTDSTRRR